MSADLPAPDVELPEEVAVVLSDALLHALWQGGASGPAEGDSQVARVRLHGRVPDGTVQYLVWFGKPTQEK